MKATVRRLGFTVLQTTMRRTFRRVVWSGASVPDLPPRPFVAYANHHAFYDAQLIGLLIERIMKRRAIVWMEELDRFPFFRVVGALPFPADDRARRFRTVRETARTMASEPTSTLIYFPEGRLNPGDNGLAEFAADRFTRLDRILPDTGWWPVAVRVTGWHEAYPTAMLGGGQWHDRPDGRERERLTSVMADLAAADPEQGTVLLRGRRSPHEGRDFSRLGRLFSRF